MGLTNNSMGKNALDCSLAIKKQLPDDKVIALAGNPNVGKSTIFNSLTGMKQHTGNWPGKTVTNAQGYLNTGKHSYVLVDIPGTYSLMAHSAEEEVARNFICFGNPDAVVVVCDATCLERNLNLVLQTMEICSNVIVCVNLMDEAKRKKIQINLPLLSKRLGIPVVGTVARKKKSLARLTNALDELCDGDNEIPAVSLEDFYSRPLDSRPLDSRQLESRPLDSRQLESRPLDSRQLESRPPDSRQLESRPPESRPPDSRQLESRPPDSRRPESRPPDSKQLYQKQSCPRQIDSKGQYLVIYPEPVEKAVERIMPILLRKCKDVKLSRWLSLKLLEQDETLIREASAYLGENLLQDEFLNKELLAAQEFLAQGNIGTDDLKDLIVSELVNSAEKNCRDAVIYPDKNYNNFDFRLDRILTSKSTGYPVMLLLLAFIFWLTIAGANYPSRLLADGLFWIQDRLTDFFTYLHAPSWLHGVLVLGVYRVLAWVVSVMLPPMAIFFPLFTLLEDAGYLPRIAYNLDKPFKCCCACGKQALTMCMGFGCNAAGVVGCRIIDSPRERLLAILTNSFVPCNGRFPALIAILTMFFIGTSGGTFSSVMSAVLLTGVILLGVAMTFGATKLLSKTLLKGVPSSFTLELPPYRKPQVGRVIVRSVFDRTLFVLGRAMAVAAPAGMIIWLMANVKIGNVSVLNHCADFLNPIGRLMGLDGVILMAFILGFPANEIVIPIIIMAYMAQGSILEMDSLVEMKQLFIANGWSWVTAVSTMLFSLMHWPCSTTLLTIKKETQSLRWTALAAALPTAAGIVFCILFNGAAKLMMSIF